ncbi:MAG: transporter substrate-binding domain-containing protein [Oscillospiraceae bacterium]|jgi:ABC-type amino acid transport substrate-binding protein|nr:transporter substrate-binding domain-containing protein [Oscillospiraceae bacterium]
MKKLVLAILISSITLFSVVPFLTACNRIPNLVNSPEDIEGKNIGGLVGTPSIRLASEFGRAFEYYSAEQMMIDLRAGLIDCVIMESTTAADLVSRTSGVRILNEPLMRYELRFAIPRENNRLLNAINNALEILERNGTLRGLSNKYFAGRNFTYSPIHGEDDPRDGTLVIALPSDSPPFSFRNEEGAFIGMDVDLAVAVADVLGVYLRVLEYDSWELVTAVHHGRADLALGWHPGEGESIISVSEPYADAEQVIIVRR